MTAFRLLVDPAPSSSPHVGELVREMERKFLLFHERTPLSIVSLAHQAPLNPRNVQLFELFTQDARSWVDQIEYFGDDLTKHSLATMSTEFAYADWMDTVSLRTAMLKTFVAMGQPSLIRMSCVALSNTVLTAFPTEVGHSQGQITVGWHSPLAGHLDWIALYLQGQPNQNYVAYQYVADGQVDGQFTFASPATPGAYEFRYLVSNSYTSTAVSDPIIVT